MDVTETAVLTATISIAGTILTNAVGRYLGRKTEAAQIRAQDGDTARDMTEAVSILIKPMREELALLNRDNTKLKSRIIAMEDEVANLKLDLRRTSDALEYLIGVSRDVFPEHVERAIRIRKGDS